MFIAHVPSLVVSPGCRFAGRQVFLIHIGQKLNAKRVHGLERHRPSPTSLFSLKILCPAFFDLTMQFSLPAAVIVLAALVSTVVGETHTVQLNNR